MKDSRALLRRQMRETRRAIPAPARIAAAQALAQHLLSLPAPATGHVAGYWAMDGEIALHAWQLRLPTSLIYCLPLLGEDGLLAFAPWRPGDALLTNRFGIPEPDVPRESLLGGDALAMVVVPLVAFDASCQRLGMGGGWYDRTFADARRPSGNSDTRHQPQLVGAAFSAQQVDAVPLRPWDVALDAVCTECTTFYGTPTIDESA